MKKEIEDLRDAVEIVKERGFGALALRLQWIADKMETAGGPWASAQDALKVNEEAA